MIGYCNNCQRRVHLAEKVQKNTAGRIQIRGECNSCGKWIMWVPYKESYTVFNLLKNHCDD